MNYQIAMEEFHAFYERLEKELQTADHDYNDLLLSALYQKGHVLLRNFYNDDNSFKAELAQLQNFNLGRNYSYQITQIQAFVVNVLDDLKIKEKISLHKNKTVSPDRYNELSTTIQFKQEAINKLVKENEELKNQIRGSEIVDSVDVHLGFQNAKLKEEIQDLRDKLKTLTNNSQYKRLFYLLLGIFLSAINLFAPIHYDVFNPLVFLLIQMTIIVTVPILYHRHVANWLQFLLGFFIAVLAIIISYLQTVNPRLMEFLKW